MSKSHNVYFDNDLKQMKLQPCYIVCNNHVLYEANNIIDALELCKSLRGFCSIFRRAGSLERYWEFYVNVCGEEINDVVA